MLAPSGLAQTHIETKAIAKLKSKEVSNRGAAIERACPLTGKGTFGSAIAALLADENLAERVTYLTIDEVGTKFWARFSYDQGGRAWQTAIDILSEGNVSPALWSHFGAPPWLHSMPPLRRSTSLNFSLSKISHLLKVASK
jgi:hypothetical protein